mgnify:CR=1 FL=1
MARNKNAHGNRQQNKKRRETLFAYSWSLPSLVLILLIVIFPILYTGYISMTNMNIYHWNNYEFIGLENYKDALLVFDNGFLTALFVTILWTDRFYHGDTSQYQGIETAECLSYPVDLPLGHAGVCIHPAVEDRNVQLPVRSVESMDDQTGNGTGEMAWK